ncbi:hypothetical protein [Amnibacterium sp.]|uniref:hypothetical protein n=1 Tax=Amnibacterium sp. TaxID=1872496 RepID=UPI00260B2F59|nr:hypothetical protein [Amnibacterium sp.]MCU1473543.1 hypothetical protein [Amnibacterium sp.]
MSEAETRQVIERYFDALGTDGFDRIVDTEVTWTVVETGRTVIGVTEVRRHLDALHAAMADTATRPLIVGEASAVLEGDAAAGAERIPFCVVYEVRGASVVAMRLYGRLEGAVLPGG